MKRTLALSFSKEELNQARLRLDGIGVAYKTPQSSEEHKAILSSYGYGNNANTYYPTIDSAKDIIPKAEDFIQAQWRLLTASVVGAYSWKATDFSNEAVLKQSVKLLDNKPIYRNHATSDIDNWVGVVNSPKWSPATLDSEGNKVPAGINAILNIDAKANPRIARGVLSNIITSNSVTVLFDWIPSHEFEDDWEFERAVGKMIDGEMVRRVVTKIYDYFETSLVYMGADPYAKKIDEDGNLVNIDITGIHGKDEAIPVKADNGFEKEPEATKENYNKNKSYHIVAPLSKCLDNKCYLKTSNMDELIKELRLKLGLAKDAEVTTEMIANMIVLSKEEDNSHKNSIKVYEELTKGIENISEYSFVKKSELVDKKEVEKLTKEVEESKGLVTSLTKEKETLAAELTDEKTKVDELTKEKETLVKFANIGKDYIKRQKDEAINLYKTSVDGKADDAVIGLFNKATQEELTGLIKQYTKGVTEKFGGKCADCGSDNFEFRSTFVQEDEKTENGYGGDIDTLRDKYADRSMDIRK